MAAEDELAKVQAHHEAEEAKARATRAERASLAARLTASFASRRLRVTVDDVEFETRYPGKDARAALFDTLARVRSMHRALAAGEPAEDDAALQAEVCRTAAALMVDESVSEDYFAGSEYGVEAALSILFAVEGALTNSAAGAASFRDDA